MNRIAIVPIVVFVAAASAFAAQAADIVLTPPAGAGVSVTNAAGNVTQFRVADDGSVTIPGTVFRGGLSFIHTFGSANSFFGLGAGNFTMTGADNTGVGGAVLLSNTTGHQNTAVGGAALVANTSGIENTALGYGTLFANTNGGRNTATGYNALRNTSTGDNNTATGADSLLHNTTGYFNTAGGAYSLIANTTGHDNTGFGIGALYTNDTGVLNTAVGSNALGLATGTANTGLGANALLDLTTGGTNIAIGANAGGGIVAGNYNIAIGVGASGAGDESNTIRIGKVNNQTRFFAAGVRGVTTGGANAIPVVIDVNGQLGTISSSERFKDDIADMGEASGALMNLRPVTFHYKADQDPGGRTLQYGLIAEEVAQVYPGLVAHSQDGQVETVMVQFLPAMLLNEVQKQRRTIERLERQLAAMQQRLGPSPEESK